MRLLLVDDEKLELQTLKDYVDWKSLGIDKVYTAPNGKEALEIIQNSEPEIVITDIQMPLVDGIALAKQVILRALPVKIVFITGYDDFSYVKAAFEVDAVDYILKPFSVKRIEETIHRVIKVIEQERMVQNTLAVAGEALIERILLEDQNEELIRQYTGIKSSEGGTVPYGIVQVAGILRKNLKDEICNKFIDVQYGVWEKDKITFLVLYYVNFYDTAVRILEYIKNTELCSVSAVFLPRKQPVKNLRGAYEICASYMKRMFYCPGGTVLEAETYDVFDIGQVCTAEKDMTQKMENRMLEILPGGNTAEVEDMIDQIFTVFESRRLTRELAEQQLFALLIAVEKKFVYGNDIMAEFIVVDRRSTVGQMHKCQNAQAVKKCLWDYIRQILTYYDVQKSDKNSYVILKVKDYVRQNYASVMSVEDMASDIHLSQNYIRSIFKENTGQTILEYITDYRLEIACSILKDKTLKVREISKMVGYDNVSYFCALFSRKYSVSPNEYRKRL